MQPSVAPKRPLVVALTDHPELEALRPRVEAEDLFPDWVGERETEATEDDMSSSDIQAILQGIKNLETGQNELERDFKTMAGDIDNLKRHATTTDERLRALEENRASTSTDIPLLGGGVGAAVGPSDSVSQAGNPQGGSVVGGGGGGANPMVLRTVITVGGFPRGGSASIEPELRRIATFNQWTGVKDMYATGENVTTGKIAFISAAQANQVANRCSGRKVKAAQTEEANHWFSIEKTWEEIQISKMSSAGVRLLREHFKVAVHGGDERLAKKATDGDWQKGTIWVRVNKPGFQKLEQYKSIIVARLSIHTGMIEVVPSSFEEAQIALDQQTWIGDVHAAAL